MNFSLVEYPYSCWFTDLVYCYYYCYCCQTACSYLDSYLLCSHLVGCLLSFRVRKSKHVCCFFLTSQVHFIWNHSLENKLCLNKKAAWMLADYLLSVFPKQKQDLMVVLMELDWLWMILSKKQQCSCFQDHFVQNMCS